MKPLALLLPGLIQAAEPTFVDRVATVPGGAAVRLRLVFRQGLQVEGARLPKAFRASETSPSGWIAFESLSPEGKRWALQALWPEDEWRSSEIRHRVVWPELESAWLLASLFSGHGQNYDQIQAVNPDKPEKLVAGDVWIIPKTLLCTDLGGPVKGVLERSLPEEEQSDETRVAAYRKLLTFDQDAQGAYAAYRLRKGEALYSSVVMRYTDRVEPKEVNQLALVIAKRSGIDNVRSIHPGALIRIPVAYLADPFQPEGSQALREEREVREEVRRTPRVDAGPKLKGVRVVLDAGHGGVDIGARANGVWESDFVYDIAMRVKRILEQDTEATVSSTIRYPGLGFQIRDAIPNPTKAAEILTTPPFANDGESPSAVSVHLRWVLANDFFTSFTKNGDARKTLFISLHADSLHPSARGTMIYVPGAASVPPRFALGAARGARVAEMKRSSAVTFTAKERLQGEARSRIFAETVLEALRRDKLPIHANRPIRNVIHRSGKSYVPAVIRHSRASTKVLVEVANLTNEEDAANLRSPAFRERFAEALVKGIRAHYRK
ncbi:MAG: N-acetylmuramoyl-L-alanine amidase [Firmicutes bacterium]|nr:N-acetylmuramoyl-L-alanine amidase [Bacillota bacterium]